MITLLLVMFLALTPLYVFASPHQFHEQPTNSYYETMGIYTHIKDTPLICIMQSETRDLMFEYSFISSSHILNYYLPQELHTYTKVIPYSEHKDAETNDYPECFVFALKHTYSEDEKFATTEFYTDYRWINMYNLTDTYNDMLYISTHEIIHAVYGIKHLQCMDNLECDGVMKPDYTEGDKYNLNANDIAAIITVNDLVQDHNRLFMPHNIPYN